LAGAQDKDADLDGDGYSLYEEYMWDTNPLSAADHPRSSLSIDPFGISLSTSRERFYTLQQSSDLRNWEAVPGLEHRRGSGSGALFSAEVPAAGTFYRVLVETE
jgi:hypothetical protein